MYVIDHVLGNEQNKTFGDWDEDDEPQRPQGIYRGDLAEAHMLNHGLARIEAAMEPDLDDGDFDDPALDAPEEEGD